MIDYKQILIDTVQHERRHKHYDRTVEVAKFARQMQLGDTQQDIIVRYRANESEAQKKQRVRLYNSLTPFVVAEIRKQLSKYKRTEHIRKVVTHSDAKAEQRIISLLKKFYADEHLEKYLFDQVLYYYMTDPNAFFITERKDVRERSTVITERVYPFEVTSEQAINYCYEHGQLKWLIAAMPRTVTRKVSSVVIETKNRTPVTSSTIQIILHDYYLYGEGVVLKLTEYESELVVDNPELETILIPVKNKKEPRVFTFESWNNGTIEVPAVRMGNIKDVQTYNSTNISIFHQVESLFRDLINLKSQDDVTRAIHVFAKLYQYAPQCTFSDNEGHICNGGHLNDRNSTRCPSCKGSGVKSHRSEQEAIELALPTDFEKFFPLDQIAHYLTPPSHVPEYLDKKTDKLIGRISIGLFGSDVFERPKAVNTATEVLQEAEEINDVLSEIGAVYSRAFKKSVRVTAQYVGLNEGLTVVHEFPNDFKTRTLTSLQNAYSSAKSNSASYEVVEGIETDIIAKLYANDPEKVKERAAWEMWRPFKSLPVEVVPMVVGERDKSDFDRVLYENFDTVRRLVNEQSNQPFWTVNYNRQKELIEQAVETIRGTVLYRTATVTPFLIDETDEDE